MATILDLHKSEKLPERNLTLTEELFPELSEKIAYIKDSHKKSEEKLSKYIEEEYPKLLNLTESLPHQESQKSQEELNQELENFLKIVESRKKLHVIGDLNVVVNEGTEEEPFYTRTSSLIAEVSTFLVLSRVDLKKVDTATLKEYVETEKESLETLFTGGLLKAQELESKLQKDVVEIIEPHLISKMQDISEKETFEGEDHITLQKLLKLKSSIRLSEEDEVKMVDSLYKLTSKHPKDGKYYHRIQQFCVENEELLWNALMRGQAERQENESASDDMETFMKRLYRLDSKEIKARRFLNEAETRTKIKLWIESGKPLSLEIIREMHKSMNKGILPFFALGLRSDNFGTNTAFELFSRNVVISSNIRKEEITTTPKEQVEIEVENMLNEANKLMSKETSKIIFEVGMAKLTARYANIHPHPDGNGTMALLFAETCFMKKGYEEITSRVADTPLRQRITETFRKNKIAETLLYGSYLIGELSYSKPRIK